MKYSVTLGLKFGLPVYGEKVEIKLIGPDPPDDQFKKNIFYVQTAKNLSWLSLKVCLNLFFIYYLFINLQ